MSGYTKGPWKAGRADMGTLVDGVTSKWIYAGEQYVAVASGHIDGEWDEVMANARLIAAAPELLEALTAVIPSLNQLPTTDYHRLAPIVHAAIAKAETPEL